MLAHPLTNFEKQKYYQNEPKFKGIYSTNNLPKMVERTFVINLYKCQSVGTH